MKIPSTAGLRRPVMAVLLALLMSACSVARPPALSNDDLMALTKSDQLAMYSNQEAISGPITEDEAIARAVKYNLRHRLALMEKALEDDLSDVKSFSMLPKLVAGAGYKVRDNEDASSSESIYTGKQSLEPSKSRQKEETTADLDMTWSILDFGLSYVEAKAQGNKALAAEERRRRAIGDIVRQTRAAYWAAISAEKMRNEVAETLVQANGALAQSREAQQRRLLAPVAALRYQRDLLNLLRQIEQLDNELAKAKAQLAALMNLAPGTEFTLAAAPDGLRKPELAYSLEDLEVLAMIRRPELREESYLARNTVLETRMSILKMFPNASLFGGLHHSSNKFLVNPNWASAGAQVSWNLLNLFSLPSVLKAGDSREAVGELRRQAMRMTVLSQVHVAWHQRLYAQKAFERANEMSSLQTAIDRQVSNAAASKAETQLELVRTKVETLLARRARDLSYAEMQNAQDAIYQAVGMDSIPEQVADLSLQGLATAIAQQGRKNEEGRLYVPALPEKPYAAAEAPTVGKPEQDKPAIVGVPLPEPVATGRPVAANPSAAPVGYAPYQPAPVAPVAASLPAGHTYAPVQPAGYQPPMSQPAALPAATAYPVPSVAPAAANANMNPAVHLVRGQPWDSLGSLSAHP